MIRLVEYLVHCPGAVLVVYLLYRWIHWCQKMSLQSEIVQFSRYFESNLPSHDTGIIDMIADQELFLWLSQAFWAEIYGTYVMRLNSLVCPNCINKRCKESTNMTWSIHSRIKDTFTSIITYVSMFLTTLAL